ncbi:MAG: hypothetical protein ACOY82_08890 [Pseudomonadota bacterium]
MSRDPQRELARVRDAVRSLSANATAWRVFVGYLAQLDQDAAERLVGMDDTHDMLRQQGAARAIRQIYVLAASADSAPHTAAAASHDPLL